MAEAVPLLLNFLTRKWLEVWNCAIIPFPLCLLMITRVLLVAIPELNKHIHIAEVIYTEDVHIVVFTTGVLLFLECSASTLSFCYHLKLWQLIRETRIRNLINWRVPTIVVLTLCSVVYAAWAFMLVRSIWTCHFFIPIQFLHAFPTIVLVLQSASQGAFLICMSARPRDAVWNRAAIDFPLHMKSHRRLNLILLVYSITMLIVTVLAGNHGDITPDLVQALFFGVLEIISRLFSAYATDALSRPPIVNYREPELVVPVRATDGVASLAESAFVLPPLHYRDHIEHGVQEIEEHFVMRQNPLEENYHEAEVVVQATDDVASLTDTDKSEFVLPHVHYRDRIEHSVQKIEERFVTRQNSLEENYRPMTRDSFIIGFPNPAGDIPL